MRIDTTELAARFGFRFVRTLGARAGRAVVQVSDDQGHLYTLKADAEVGALDGDVAAIHRLGAAGLPVPEVVAHRAGPPAVLILRWIDGDPVSSASPVAAQQEVGRLLRVVHALPGGPPFSGEPSVERWITAWTTEVADWWSSAGASAAQVDRLRAWLAELTPVLAARSGTLTLFDGRAEHFLVRAGRVVGVIDLHDVGPGDPAMDLAALALTDEHLLSGVLEGYAAGADEQEVLARLVPFYVALRRLAGAEWHLRVGDQVAGRELLGLAAAQLVVPSHRPT